MCHQGARDVRLVARWNLRQAQADRKIIEQAKGLLMRVDGTLSPLG